MSVRCRTREQRQAKTQMLETDKQNIKNKEINTSKQKKVEAHKALYKQIGGNNSQIPNNNDIK